MTYTSYFANWRKFPDNMKTVSIAQFTQSWINVDLELKELAPSKEILLGYKNGSIDDEQYDKMYTEQLNNIDNILEIITKIDNSILLCYEKKGDPCHRHILSKWLREKGVDIEEL